MPRSTTSLGHGLGLLTTIGSVLISRLRHDEQNLVFKLPEDVIVDLSGKFAKSLSEAAEFYQLLLGSSVLVTIDNQKTVLQLFRELRLSHGEGVEREMSLSDVLRRPLSRPDFSQRYAVYQSAKYPHHAILGYIEEAGLRPCNPDELVRFADMMKRYLPYIAPGKFVNFLGRQGNHDISLFCSQTEMQLGYEVSGVDLIPDDHYYVAVAK